MKRLFSADPQAPLTVEQLHYLRDVLRLSDGEVIEVFDGRGAAWRAELRGERLLLHERLPRSQRALDVTLVQALARGEKMDLVVQKATELGAARIVPLRSERSEVKLDAGRGAAKQERWQRIAQEAARQSGRADVPRVDAPCGWADVHQLLRGEPDRRGLLLDPEAALKLGDAARGAGKLLLAIGPEGGFSPQERTEALQNGFTGAALGRLVLRTETSGLAALAIALHVNGELG
ncbi:MAG TPA: 16S rRNA (uracil(1498)-N(3))-methyltransferase [Myxococcales bacterium]|nr:16S rRNA (uracil(1498)-N(3))-methyltransferase [Myxococcales bacterium]